MLAPTALICDFLEWLEARPRDYAEAMEVWRTSCPRLTIWEDAVEAGFVRRDGRTRAVEATDLGRAFVKRERPRGQYQVRASPAASTERTSNP